MASGYILIFSLRYIFCDCAQSYLFKLAVPLVYDKLYKFSSLLIKKMLFEVK